MTFNIEFLHAYKGEEELPRLLQFVGECNRLANFCGYVHPGDEQWAAWSQAGVKHEPPQKNPASGTLYRSVGFTIKYTITNYRKQRETM